MHFKKKATTIKNKIHSWTSISLFLLPNHYLKNFGKISSTGKKKEKYAILFVC